MADQAARRREYVVLILGVGLIVIAGLFIFNGKPSNFTWEYPACVAWREVSCPHIPVEAHCNVVGAECIQTQMRLFPWVHAWLVEAGLVTVLAVAAAFWIFRRK